MSKYRFPLVPRRKRLQLDGKKIAGTHLPRGFQLPQEFVRRCTVWMRRELPLDSTWKAWVAVDGGEIVGQIWVHTIPKIPNPIAELEKLAYVSNLYVKVSARGGTGTRLLQSALEWCRANQIDRVVLWPTKRSVTLYLGHGFSHGGDVMELKIRS